MNKTSSVHFRTRMNANQAHRFTSSHDVILYTDCTQDFFLVQAATVLAGATLSNHKSIENTKRHTYFTMESVIIISSTNWLNSPLIACREENDEMKWMKRNATECEGREGKRREEKGSDGKKVILYPNFGFIAAKVWMLLINPRLPNNRLWKPTTRTLGYIIVWWQGNHQQ